MFLREIWLIKMLQKLKRLILKRNSTQCMMVKKRRAQVKMLIYLKSFKIRIKVLQKHQKKLQKSYLNSKLREKN
jgi:hypothetical protein